MGATEGRMLSLIWLLLLVRSWPRAQVVDTAELLKAECLGPVSHLSMLTAYAVQF